MATWNHQAEIAQAFQKQAKPLQLQLNEVAPAFLAVSGSGKGDTFCAHPRPGTRDPSFPTRD